MTTVPSPRAETVRDLAPRADLRPGAWATRARLATLGLEATPQDPRFADWSAEMWGLYTDARQAHQILVALELYQPTWGEIPLLYQAHTAITTRLMMAVLRLQDRQYQGDERLAQQIGLWAKQIMLLSKSARGIPPEWATLAAEVDGAQTAPDATRPIPVIAAPALQRALLLDEDPTARLAALALIGEAPSTTADAIPAEPLTAESQTLEEAAPLGAPGGGLHAHASRGARPSAGGAEHRAGDPAQAQRPPSVLRRRRPHGVA